ncbi:sel1 repeat family protein [Pseudomonas sp. C2L12B]|uniref:Sel1 repeat family protein n=1 Tax=Pseudomonas typographi TaxID=2715964 RepID=A0ABR7YYL4_9PSED|nr:sel1 repeat family protein [Pseudomonas typographi]MBD1550809.1 sel1 repeat family protein [Pseudomonas typographi]MBD1587751.1 sel1 repeat family protein [Pseudomonas typographi]MBD1598274.1 sel1 repeat family protein [Pseudomonas typographi]
MTVADTFKKLHRPALLGLAVAIGLAGCAGLPDQRLANEALKNGDIALAQRNYQQLADMGYVDAQIGLADTWVDSGDPAQLAKAEATYRAAAATSPRAQSRLGKLLAMKPNATEAEHHEAESLLKQAFDNGEPGVLMPLALLYLQYPQSFPNVNAQQKISQWRAAGYPEAGLAQIVLYRIQNTYDQHLGEVESICKQALNTNDICYVELATVYQKQNRTADRDGLLQDLKNKFAFGFVSGQRVDSVARVLADPTLGTPDPKTAKELLEAAAPSYPAAYISLADLEYGNPDLADIDQIKANIDKGHDADPTRAELLLGRIAYEGKSGVPDAKGALEHFEKSVPEQVSGYYYIGQIYRRGYLGYVEPQKAVDNLLTAARRGQNSADFALAQLYSGGRGTMPNLTNAYVFIQLAKARMQAIGQPRPEVDELFQTIEQQVTPEQRAQAQQILHQEMAARGAMSQDSAAVAMHALPENQEGEDESL